MPCADSGAVVDSFSCPHATRTSLVPGVEEAGRRTCPTTLPWVAVLEGLRLLLPSGAFLMPVAPFFATATRSRERSKSLFMRAALAFARGTGTSSDWVASGMGIAATADCFAASAAISAGSRMFHWQIFIIVSPLHQIDMDMVFMIRVCTIAKYGRKASARRLP